MSGLALGLGVGGALLGTGAQLYSANQAGKAGVKQHDIGATGYFPGADPLLSMLSMNALAGVGGFDPNIYRQSSPVQQALNQALQSGMLNQRQYRLFQSALGENPELLEQARNLKGKERKAFLKEHGLEIQDLRGLPTAEQFAQSAGYGSLQNMFNENQAYLGRLPEIQAQFQPVAERMRTGTLASQGRIADYLQNLPNLLTGDQNPFIDQLRQEALHTSQKYGVNPYQFLEQARSTALQRALQLVSGEQAALAGQQQAALPAAQLRQQGGASAANIGASQAQALAAALQSQSAAQQNAIAMQGQAYGNLGNTLGQFGLIGADMYANRNTGPAADTSVGTPTSNNYAVGNWEP